MNILDNNLANITYQIDLFGGKTPKLKMSERIGFLPISVWKPNWELTKQLKAIVGDDGSTRQTISSQTDSLMGAKVGVSIFNPHLAQMILSAYCPQNAKIFDPFGGGGTRGFMSSAMGHDYTGVEIRLDEVERIKQQQIKLNTFFNIICQDCRLYPIEPETFDFCFTCPPYYDLEVYSTLDGDMSNAQTYEEFLIMLKRSLEVTYRGLKPNSLAVWVVGNFRDRAGWLVNFNASVANLAKSVGFNLLDELIFWGASNAAVQRSGQFEANRKSVRVHEYILILKK